MKKTLLILTTTLSFCCVSQNTNILAPIGNVGIGTLFPTAKLEVKGSTLLQTLSVTGGAIFKDNLSLEKNLNVLGNTTLRNTVVNGVLNLPQTPLTPTLNNTTQILLKDPTTNEVLTTSLNELITNIYKSPCLELAGLPGGPIIPKTSPIWASKPGVLYTLCPNDLRVGIGTENPSSTLHVAGNAYFEYILNNGDQINKGTLFVEKRLSANEDIIVNKSIQLGGFNNSGKLFVSNSGQNDATVFLSSVGNPNFNNKLVYFEYNNPNTEIFNVKNTTNNKTIFQLKSNGFMSIANNDGSKLLELESGGKLKTREIVVETALWPDYVFKPEYNLKPLSEVKIFINNNGHLPNVPSAVEVEKNGLNVEEASKAMLEKIEELTLYLIQQQEELEALKQKITQLENK